MRTLKVRGIPFVSEDCDGDFTWMRKQEEYANSLLIYNDNFIHSLNTEKNIGGGSAAVRDECWRFSNKPRTAGIPTGWSVRSGGFDEANKMTQLAIDCAFDRICLVLQEQPEISEIIFSSNKDDDKKIGSSRFDIKKTIVDYISNKIFELEYFDRTNFKNTHASIDSKEHFLKPHAVLQQRFARECELRLSMEIEWQKRRLAHTRQAQLTSRDATKESGFGRRSRSQSPLSPVFS